MRRFAPRLPVTCHSLNPSPPLVRSSNNSLSYPSSCGYDLSSFLFYIYIYIRFFSSFQKFSKNCNNDYRTSLIGIVSFNTLVLTRNDLPPSSSPPFSFSGRVGEDDRCRMERRERCNIGGVASFFVHDSTTIISRTYFTQLLSFLFILLLLLLLHHPAFSLGFDRRGTRSERANGQEVR